MSDALDALTSTAGQVAGDIASGDLGEAANDAAQGAAATTEGLAEDAANAVTAAGSAVLQATGGAVDFGAHAGGGHVGVDADLFGHGVTADVGVPGSSAAHVGLDAGAFRSGEGSHGDAGAGRDARDARDGRPHDPDATRRHDTDFGRGAHAGAPHTASTDHAFGAGATHAPAHVDAPYAGAHVGQTPIDPAHATAGLHLPVDAPHVGHEPALGGLHDPLGHGLGIPGAHDPGIPGAHDPIGHDTGATHDALDHHPLP